jgi:hypothetical protein
MGGEASTAVSVPLPQTSEHPSPTETAPGELTTRGRLVVGRNGERWEIITQQLTRISPPPF